MALTTIDILERVRNRVAPDAPARALQKLDYVIETNINGALARLARIVAQSAEFHLLQKEFTFTPVAGVGDLTTIAGTDEDTILYDSVLRTGHLRFTSDAASKTPLIRVPRYQSLYSSSLPSDAVHYFIRSDKKVVFRATDGTINSFVTPMTLTASVIPTVASLPPQFENLFIDILTEMVAQKGGIVIAPDEQSVTN